MISSLENLARYIRTTIPYAQSIRQLNLNTSAGGVTFIWYGTEFFVKPSLHVLEIRGHSLYITGLSTLLQSVLMGADHSGKKCETVLEVVNQAEDLVRIQSQPRAAAQMLAGARQILERMAGHSSAPPAR
jgi:hypothetical protein